MNPPWPEREKEIVAWLDLLAPHVVFLQEVVESSEGNQAQRLAEASAYQYHIAYGVSLDFGGGRFGNAILSRWPIDDHTTALLPYEPSRGDVQRILLHARSHRLDLFCTHLTSYPGAGQLREAEVREIVRLIEERADRAGQLPTILAGDLNADPDSPEIRHLCERELGGHGTPLQDSWKVADNDGPGWTYDRRNPFATDAHRLDRRIDYVFVGLPRREGAGRIQSARLVCDRALTGTFASDHFGLLVHLTVPGR